MFVCSQCADKYEGPSVEWAKGFGPASYGKCELCDKPGRECFDIPSSGHWWPKKTKKEKK